MTCKEAFALPEVARRPGISVSQKTKKWAGTVIAMI